MAAGLAAATAGLAAATAGLAAATAGLAADERKNKFHATCQVTMQVLLTFSYLQFIYK